MFQSFQSFLAFLFALLTVYTLIRAFRLDSLLDPARDFWKRIGKTGRVCATISVVFLAGHAVSKELLRGGGGNANLPDWFIALQYNPADTDGDGIPDCWERWTRTKPLIADANLDPDGDGVDNFGEFWNQCDPLMKDTDGDGYSDKLEIEGRAAGKTWFNPIVRAVYEYDDPDVNTNGVPDRWEGLGYVYGYTDANNDGLPDGLSFPEYGGGNFDVEVIVSTTRAALLSWGSSTNEAIVLPPCSCLPIRLRLSSLKDNDVRLSCGTAGDGSEGLWYGRLVIRWPDDCGYETEANRLQIDSDSVIDCDAMEVLFRGEVQTEPQRSPQNDVPTSITSPFRRRWINVFGISGGCWEHDTNIVAAIAVYTNITPPFIWYIGDSKVDDWHEDFLTIGAFPTNETQDIHFSCEWTGEVQHHTIRIMDSNSIRLDHCPSDTTNIIGAAWTSSHSHTNAADHVPYHIVTNLPPHGPNCPIAQNHTYCVGWDHAKVNTRNLVAIVASDNVDHCLGLVSERGNVIHLLEYLDTSCSSVFPILRFRVNGNLLSKGSDSLVVPQSPDDLTPQIFFVEVLNAELTPLDYLWVVVSCKQAKKLYDDWKAAETNLVWTLGLPKPFATLAISTNSLGNIVVNDTGLVSWNRSEEMNQASFMHHDASYEMRSFAIAGGHGHQATYNASGELITSTIAAGTADKVSPQSIWNGTAARHRMTDVHPYIRALQLDGNPILTDNLSGMFTDSIPTRFSRPCLFQGDEANAYLDRRPPTPTGVQY